VRDFDDGSGYIKKVSSSRLHLLRLTFGDHPVRLPIFDLEVLYKTVKGTFHDVKAECMTPAEYNRAAPIFLHRLDRSSGIFEFLAQFDPLMTWVVALGAAVAWYQKSLAADHELDEKRLTFIRTTSEARDGRHEGRSGDRTWRQGCLIRACSILAD